MIELTWHNGRPDCERCDDLLRNPLFVEASSSAEMASKGRAGTAVMSVINRYHLDGHRLRLPGEL